MREALVFLAAAVVCVPVAARLGLGSVLGYLIAGAAIGPWGLGLAADVTATQTLVLVDLDERRACAVPDWYRQQIAAFEGDDLA